MNPPPARTIIVGAGPAGVAAALALAEAGIGSTVLERGPAVPEALRSHGLVDARPAHDVTGLSADLRLRVSYQDDIAAQAVLVASGALEVIAPIPGWTVPGVFPLSALGAGNRAGSVVLGGAGPLLYRTAATLVRRGAVVAAVVDAAGLPRLGHIALMATSPALIGRGLAWVGTLLRAKVAILLRAAITAVEPGPDGGAVAVEIARVERDWTPRAGARRRIAAATVGLGLGMRPVADLLLQAGCSLEHDAWLGGWHPGRDETLETSVRGLWAAGDCAGARGHDNARAEGIIAAAAIARRQGRSTPALDQAAEAAQRATARGFSFRAGLNAWSALRPGIFAAADENTVVCRCTGATKRQVLAGAGTCGPSCRDPACLPATLALLADAAGREPHQVAPGWRPD